MIDSVTDLCGASEGTAAGDAGWTGYAVLGGSRRSCCGSHDSSGSVTGFGWG
jgi:hypothetical protein